MAILGSTSLPGFDIQPVKSVEQYYNFLIYGEPGVGKTLLAGSADDEPAMRPVLVVDVEGGTSSLVHAHPDVQTVRVKSWDEMQRLYNALADMKHGYKTVIIDSLSEVQKFNMMNIMKRVAEENPRMTEDVPSMREWGINLEQMRRFVRAFRDLPMHTIFTAHEQLKVEESTGRSSVGPSFSGKLANEIAGFLDEVFYMYVKKIGDEQKRVLLTGKTEREIAKDRSGALDIAIVDPTMKKVFTAMKKGN